MFKKKTLLVLLPAVMLLSACNNPNISSSNSPESTPVTSETTSTSTSVSESESSTTPVPTAWSEDAVALMKANLNNNVIPFFNMENTTVAFDAEQGILAIKGALKEGQIDSYAKILIDAQYSTGKYTDDEVGEFVQGTMIDSSFGEVAVVAYNTTNNFLITAMYTVGTTEWPASEIEESLSLLGLVSNIPSFQADHYIVNQSFLSVSIQALGQKNVATSEDVYTTSLEAEGYTIDKTTYETNGIIATSAKGDVLINYAFMSGILAINIANGDGVQVNTWPGDRITSFLAEEGVTADLPIPTFTRDTYTLDYTYSGCLYVNMTTDGLTLETSEDVYKAACVEAGYTIDASKVTTEGYYAVNKTKTYAIQFAFSADYGEFFIGFMSYDTYLGYSTSEAWPATNIATFVGDKAITVPAYVEGEKVLTYKEFNDEETSTFNVKIEKVATTAVVDYKAALTAAGFTVTDVTEKEISATDSTNSIVISASLDAENSILNIAITHYSAPVVDGTFNFANEAQLITKNETKSIWKSGEVTLTVEKGDSPSNVGNTSYFSNPLRLYSNQVITIEIPNIYKMRSVTINANLGSSKSKMTTLTGGTIEGATITAETDVATLTPTAGTKQIKITLASSGQFHIDSIVVDYILLE